MKSLKLILPAVLLAILITLCGCSISESGIFHRNATDKSGNTLYFSTQDLGLIAKPFDQPFLSGNTLVWAGDVKGGLHNSDGLFLMDITDRNVSLVAKTIYKNDAHVTCPQVDKNWITWLDSGLRDGVPQYTLFALNRDSKVTFPVVTFSMLPQKGGFIAWARLDGDRLIWSQPNPNGLAQICYIDLATKTKKTICTTESSLCPAPYISENLVVWEDGKLQDRNGNVEVFDLSTGTIEKKFQVQGRYAYPKIFSTNVLYSPEAYAHGPAPNRSFLVIYDIKTGSEIRILAPDNYFWDIGQGFITWSSYVSGGESKVYIRGVEKNDLTQCLGSGALPVACGDVIVWQSPRGEHVFLSQISTSKEE